MLNQAQHHEDVWRSGDIAPLILTLVLDVKGIATRAGRLTPEKEPTSYQLRGGLSGLQSQSACC